MKAIAMGLLLVANISFATSLNGTWTLKTMNCSSGFKMTDLQLKKIQEGLDKTFNVLKVNDENLTFLTHIENCQAIVSKYKVNTHSDFPIRGNFVSEVELHGESTKGRCQKMGDSEPKNQDIFIDKATTEYVQNEMVVSMPAMMDDEQAKQMCEGKITLIYQK